LVAASKFLVAATKNLCVVPDFVAVTKPFFFREARNSEHVLSVYKDNTLLVESDSNWMALD